MTPLRMGRHSGFIALHAGLAARHADIVLLPEMTIRDLASKSHTLDHSTGMNSQCC